MARHDRSHYIRQVASAARKRERADENKRAATEELREGLRQAHQAGATITELAHVAHLSRQGVYDLLGERPS